MIRAAVVLAMLVFPGLASAQEWVPRRVGEIQALDKVNARVMTLRAVVGEPARFGTLTILLRACHSRAADEVPDAAAWMEVTDEHSPPGSGPVFRGWMFADAPAVNMFEHPVYDLRILNCR
ncbi:MAG: cellulase-like protein [Rubritepida sp.]|nr:cellulase-like protein [Rubritepida sp.]